MKITNDQNLIRYDFIEIDGLKIFYREAGTPGNPKLVLLHGFPSSSHQYRNLIPALAGKFHVIAPDYPGFGLSDHPDPANYDYTFDGIASAINSFLEKKEFNSFGLYVQDYGGPVGFRIVGVKPEKLEWLIIQNSNAYEVGFTGAWDGFRGALWRDRSAANEKQLAPFLEKDAIKMFYTHGAKDPAEISPDNWEMDNNFMQLPFAKRVNMDLFYDYRTNVSLYPKWQEFMRTLQPKTIIFWGQTDIFFTPEGGEAFLKDLPNAEMHRLDGGHFAVENNLTYIAENMIRFYKDNLSPAAPDNGLLYI